MGRAADLAAADSLPVGRLHLRAHPVVLGLVGDDPDRACGYHNRPPYPRLVLRHTPSGSDRGLLWLMEQVLQLEAYGDPDLSTGDDVLRALLYAGLGALAELPDLPQPLAPGLAVVTNVGSRGSGGPSYEPTGQPRWVGTLAMSVHPPHPTD